MLKDLEIAYVELFVTFNQVEAEAQKLAKKLIGKEIPLKVEGEDDYPDLRIRIEIDDSTLTDDEVAYLEAYGFAASQPYRAADIVLEELTQGVPFEIEPRLGYDETDNYGTYFVIRVPYEFYKFMIHDNS